METMMAAKLRFLETMASVGMSWWVSGVVFCATVLAVFWLKREVVVTVPFFHLLCVTLTVFYASIVFFGLFISWEAWQLEKEVRRTFGDTAAGATFETVEYGYLIGTTSFALIATCWLGLWKVLHRLRLETLELHRRIAPAARHGDESGN